MAETGATDAGLPAETFAFVETDSSPAPTPETAAAPAPPSDKPGAADAPSQAADATKDGDGKGAAADPPAAGTETHEGEEAGDEPPSEPEPGPFKFAGRSFKTPEDAEKWLERSRKSAEGRIKAEAKRAQKELEAREKAAIESAHAWKAEAERRAQPQDKPAAAPTKEPEKDPLESLDWRSVRKLAEDEGLDAALYHGFSQFKKLMEAEVDKRLEARTKPFEQDRQAQQLQSYVTNLVHSNAELKYEEGPDAGKPVYPELSDADAIPEIVRIWQTLPPQVMATDRGIHIAVVEYRDHKRQSAPRTKAPAPNGAPDVHKSVAANPPPPESLNGGGVPRQNENEDRAARFKREFVEVGAPVMAGSQPLFMA